MAEQTTDDGITVQEIDAAYEVLEILRENFQSEGMGNLAEIANEAHYLVQQYDEGARWTGVVHSLTVGTYAIDDVEPTPSPEVNTVEVVELTGQRADEYETDEGKLVSEYKHNRFYPDDDPVVKGVYPNMSGDDVWCFPESRLR